MAAKPHILFILHLPPPVHGAAMVGQYIHDSAPVNAGFDCRFINLTTAGGMGDIGRFKWKKIRPFLALLRRIRKEVKEFRPELVYVTPNARGGPFYKDFAVVMMLKRMGCRVVAHYHNKGVAARQDRPLDDFLYRRFFKGLKVILLSEKLYPDIRKYVKRGDVLVCPNGIPCGTAPLREAPGDGTPRILFLSNLLTGKGILVLLDALGLLEKKGLRFDCALVGGETQDFDTLRLEEAVRQRELEGCVHYLGRKEGEDKAACLERADLFVLPSLDECFPLVLLEAMAHGLPCISTDEGGITDIIDDGVTGLIARKRDPADLAEKIGALLEDASLRRQMGAAAREKYDGLFTLEKFERRFTDCLHALLE